MKISAENLSFSYGERSVLQDVSFSLSAGEVMAVLGPNGVGKSTLFRCLLGNLHGYRGTILVDGKDLKALSPRERARKIAYIPQHHRPTFGYTVLDTALMGTSRHISLFLSPGKEQEQIAWAALERVGAAHLGQRDFSRLSGGEQQLVLLGRALAQQADILIMDEPAASLDYGNRLRLLQLMEELAREGYTVLFSTHDPQQALQHAHQVLALSGGRVAACGAAKEVITTDLIRQLYRVETEFFDTPRGTVILPEVEK